MTSADVIMGHDLNLEHPFICILLSNKNAWQQFNGCPRSIYHQVLKFVLHVGVTGVLFAFIHLLYSEWMKTSWLVYLLSPAVAACNLSWDCIQLLICILVRYSEPYADLMLDMTSQTQQFHLSVVYCLSVWANQFIDLVISLGLSVSDQSPQGLQTVK